MDMLRLRPTKNAEICIPGAHNCLAHTTLPERGKGPLLSLPHVSGIVSHKNSDLHQRCQSLKPLSKNTCLDLPSMAFETVRCWDGGPIMCFCIVVFLYFLLCCSVSSVSTGVCIYIYSFFFTLFYFFPIRTILM